MRNGLITWQPDRLVGVDSLLKATVVLTFACNLRCTYCDVEHLDKRMLRVAELSKLFTALRARGAAQLNFIGGEPFVRRDLGEILAEARRLAFRTVVHSNGKFPRPVTEAVCAAIDVFHTCLNGRLPAHEQTRGAGTYEPALQSIRLMRSRGVAVVADMILTADNADEDDIEHVLQTARELDFRVNFQPVFEHQLVAADAQRVSGMRLPADAMRAVFTMLRDRYDQRVMYNSQAYLDAVVTDGVPVFDKCLNGRRTVVVGPQGHVARCFKYIQVPGNPNGVELGWDTALARIGIDGCTTCPYSNHAEDNLALGGALRFAAVAES